MIGTVNYFNGNSLLIWKDGNGEYWYQAAAIAKILGYSRSSHLMGLVAEDHYMGDPASIGKTYICDYGLIGALERSTKPLAKEFKEWIVTSNLVHQQYLVEEASNDQLVSIIANLEREMKGYCDKYYKELNKREDLEEYLGRGWDKSMSEEEAVDF